MWYNKSMDKIVEILMNVIAIIFAGLIVIGIPIGVIMYAWAFLGIYREVVKHIKKVRKKKDKE